MKRLTGLLALALLLAGVMFAQSGLMITGAGATFPNPIYSKWFDQFHKSNGTQINYQPVGSGAGIKQVTDGTVDFGASDGPMNDDQLKGCRRKSGLGFLPFPQAPAGSVLPYSVRGVAAPLTSPPEARAGFFLGRTPKGNDPPIANAKKGETLPANDIVVIHRSDGSGT